MKKLATLAGLSALGTFASAQTLLLYTNFNDTSSVGAFLSSSVNLLSGNYTVAGATAAPTFTSPGNGNFGSFSGTLTNAQLGDPAGGAFVVVGTASNGATLTLQMNTTGYKDLRLKDVFRRTGTGFNDIDIDISTNGGGSWSALVSNHNASSSAFPAAPDIDTVLPVAAENNADVRIRFTFSGATSTSGNMRMDNLTIHGNVVPEPATLAAVGLGLGALLRRKRR
ncbi:MAG: PEP-CTERM sorting domain-containing protein [Chthonomonas sp.]|nr:PEP-CTERM sorting domain-containing protein [Chthonomonas sp.]